MSARTGCARRATSSSRRRPAEGLADAVDIYVEDIAFSIEDLEAVAEAAAPVGLPLRVHADQLGRPARPRPPCGWAPAAPTT